MRASLFLEAAPQYAAAGIAVVPLGGEDGKRPLVKQPQRFGIRGSQEIAFKFPDANVGVWCGRKNGLTVVDIDSTDVSEVRWVLDNLAPSPVISRTGSSHHHVYYGHDGEGRHINAFPGHKIDLLGNGLCVAPPSVRPGGGRYEFVQGGLADLRRLPVIPKEALARICRSFRGAGERLVGQGRATGEAWPDISSDGAKSGRNDRLFRLGLSWLRRSTPRRTCSRACRGSISRQTNHPWIEERCLGLGEACGATRSPAVCL